MIENNNTAVMLLKNGFEEAEAVMVIDFLRRMQINIKVVSVEESTSITGYWGLKMQSDYLFSDIQNQIFAAVIVVGGPKNTDALQQDSKVIDFLQKHIAQDKYICGECSAPAKVLAFNGLLDGKNMTCNPDFKDKLPKQCTFHRQAVVQDGKFINCIGIGKSFEFAAVIAQAMGCSKEAVLDQLKHMEYSYNEKEI